MPPVRWALACSLSMSGGPCGGEDGSLTFLMDFEGHKLVQDLEGLSLTLGNVDRSLGHGYLLECCLLSRRTLGLWISLHWPGQHQGAYFGIGLLLGVIGVIASWIFVILFHPPGVYKAGDRAILILAYPMWCTAMTVAGGLYGDSVKSRMGPSETTNLVRRFAGGVGVCGAIFVFVCEVAV
jgi:hypothetical protein